jgi:hypothetical protein
MYSPIRLNLKIQLVRNSVRRLPLWCGFLVIALTCFALSLAPKAFAVNPPPDGGYPNNNTAEGTGALSSLTTGTDNTALGFNALFSNTDGSFNTVTGSGALQSNTTGSFNTANGVEALFSNTTGFNNTANGSDALFSNTTGGDNTADGHDALYNNTTGFLNTANGSNALYSNTTGFSNTATGGHALINNTTGGHNTANGVNALLNNKNGNFNTAEGFFALAHSTGSNNIALGSSAGINLTTGNHNIDIGNGGVAGESKRIRIGTVGIQKGTFIAGIHGQTIAQGIGVVIDADGHLGTVTSSKRFKDEIKPMDKASEAILALKPVTFRYKHELDSDGTPQFGLIAEQVEKVNPDLIARDEEGKAYTVRYEAVNAMLLNEFLKEHRNVEEQTRKNQDQEATISQMKKQIEVLTTDLQKVSEQVEGCKSAPN